MSILDEMDSIVETFSRAINKQLRCKGKNCHAKCGVGHSAECIQEHSDVVKGAPKCFDRAEHNGRLFDNCRFYNDCANVKPICTDNPLG